MKIGITVWQNRVSPVFDTARTLLLVELEDNVEVSREMLDIPNLAPAQKAQFIRLAGVQQLICGAVSNYLERHLVAQGVEVLPWIRGSIEGVLAAYYGDQLESNNFQFPGCGCGRRRNRRGPGGGCGRNRNKTNQEDI